MKAKKILIIVCSIVVVCVAMMFYFKPSDEIIYYPTVYDVEDFKAVDDQRYIILYQSNQDKYYLGTVLGSGAIDDVLYDLGEEPCNFKKVNDDVFVISNRKEIVYANGKYDQLPKDVYDIKALGNLKIDITVEHDMQIVKRESVTGNENCFLSPTYYYDYIPVDVFATIDGE